MKITLYIAPTLDGYIAGPNGEVNWLSMVDQRVMTAVTTNFMTQSMPWLWVAKPTIYAGLTCYHQNQVTDRQTEPSGQGHGHAMGRGPMGGTNGNDQDHRANRHFQSQPP